ncbi:5'-3' exonuclease [Domibacillus epiphyticus]|nr:5'-3' exonuclease [Domibacillus epiphyticus]
METKRLLLVDGMALLFRSFFQTAPSGRFMYNEHQIPTNAVHGLIRHLFAAAEKIKPTHITICWDMGKDTFRTEMFDSYKAHRPAPPTELIPQFELAREATEAFSLNNAGVKGFEADDCIGTISKLANGIETYILTGDRDLLQLLNGTNFVWLLQTGYGNWKTYDQQIFIEEYGIEPAQFHYVKALMGDTADGYPGVKGIGEKTALKLIQQFDTIDGVMNGLDELTPSVRKKILDGVEMLRLSEKLAAIHCDVPLNWSLDAALYTGADEKANNFISANGMTGLSRFARHTGFITQDPFTLI